LGSTNNNLPLYRFLKTFLLPPFRFQKKQESYFRRESSDSAAPVRLLLYLPILLLS
jgi:hypothetical protein